MGRRHRPFFRINAVEKREKRDGRVIEELGWYDPLVKGGESVKVNAERVKHWISQGAQPSDAVLDLLITNSVIDEPKLVARRDERIAHRKALQAERAKAAATEGASE